MRTSFAILWLAVAVVAGLFGSWLWAQRGPGDVAPAQTGEDSRNPELIGGKASPSLQGQEPRATGEEPDPVSSPEPARLVPEGTAGWIDVRISDLPGFVEKTTGKVWLLPAGAPGVDDWRRVTHAQMKGGHATLAVPRAGTFDVGVSLAQLVHLERDVEVVAGQQKRLIVPFPILGEITFKFDKPPQFNVVWINVVRDDRKGRHMRQFPGRDDDLGPVLADQVQAKEGGQAVARVPHGHTYRLEPHISLLMGGIPLKHRAVCDPPVASVGEEVHVRFVPRPTVDVALKWDEDIPEHSVAYVSLGGPGQTTQNREVRRGDSSVRLWGTAGPATLTWYGPHVPRDESESFEISSQTPAQITIHLQKKGPEQPASPETELVAVRPDGVASTGTLVVAFLDGRPGWPAFVQVLSQDNRLRFTPPTPRDALEDVYIACGAHYGRFDQLRTGMGHELPLQAGGFVRVVLEQPATGELGPLSLRTLDGRRIWRTNADGRGRDSLVFVSPNLLLGPLPPGTHRFALYQGSIALGTVETNVEALRTKALVIR